MRLAFRTTLRVLRAGAACALLAALLAAPALAAKKPPAPAPAADPQIAYIVAGTKPKVMVCNADGSNAVAVYTGAREKNLNFVRFAPRDPADPDGGSVIFVEGERSVLWQEVLKRARFTVENGAIVVTGVDQLTAPEPTPILFEHALSPDGSHVYFVRAGHPTGVPDRLQALSLATLEEETVCRWPDWGSGWPEPDCTNLPPDWPEWVFERLLGPSPDGSRLLLNESNWVVSTQACPEFVTEVRYVELDLGAPWGDHLCELTTVYGPTTEISVSSGATARFGHEIALDAAIGGLGAIWRLDYDADTVTLVPGTEAGTLPSWSCDDSSLVFARFAARNQNIFKALLPDGPVSVLVTPGWKPHWGRCP